MEGATSALLGPQAPRAAGYQSLWALARRGQPASSAGVQAGDPGGLSRRLARCVFSLKTTDGVGFEAVSVSPFGSNNLRHGLREGEAKGEAVFPAALFGGGLADTTAARAERLGSPVEADAIPTEVAELAAVWHRLPAAVRAGIVAMVRASGG